MTESFFRFFQRAFVFGALVVGAAAPATAQDEPTADDDPSRRAATFRAVSGPDAERVPGGTLTVIAYAGAWVLILGYFWRVGRLHARTAEDLAALRKSIGEQRS
ncbi:MAG: hypothetical protein KF901_18275 [Myxococcales bacterium]|nr:hypothetical protein [Myxococcales bacterium]